MTQVAIVVESALPPHDSTLRSALEKIGGELHAQYIISYQTNAAHIPGFHSISVQVSHPMLLFGAPGVLRRGTGELTNQSDKADSSKLAQCLINGASSICRWVMTPILICVAALLFVLAFTTSIVAH
jgi:hypothetical protein